jgi:hypothetical protein
MSYIPFSFMTLFMNVVMRPSGPRTQENLTMLPILAGTIQSMGLTTVADMSVEEIEASREFAIGLVRLGNSALRKAKRDARRGNIVLEGS